MTRKIKSTLKGIDAQKHIKFHDGLENGGTVFSLIVFADSSEQVINNGFTMLMQAAREKRGMKFKYCPVCGVQIRVKRKIIKKV